MTTRDQWRRYRLTRSDGKKMFYNSRIARDQAARRYANRDGQRVGLMFWDPDQPTTIRGIYGVWVEDGEVQPDGLRAAR